jgi:hypothetical protein
MAPNSPAPITGSQSSIAQRLRTAILATIIGLAVGIGLHLFTTYLEQNGPRIGPLAFNGNGATVVPFCLAPIILVVGVVILLVRKAYLAAALSALSLIVGFVVLGPF